MYVYFVVWGPVAIQYGVYAIAELKTIAFDLHWQGISHALEPHSYLHSNEWGIRFT